MRLYNFFCSECSVALTSKNGVPEGHKVKCPKCGAAFVARSPADEETIKDSDLPIPPPPTRRDEDSSK